VNEGVFRRCGWACRTGLSKWIVLLAVLGRFQETANAALLSKRLPDAMQPANPMWFVAWFLINVF